MAEHGKRKEPETTSIREAIAEKFKSIPTLSKEEAERRADERRRREVEQEKIEISGRLRKLALDCGSRLDPFQVCTLGNFEQYDAKMADTLSALNDYLDHLEIRIDRGDSIFLIGPPGTGKDHLAISIAREAVIHHGKTARWADAASFRSELRDAIKSTKEERKTFAPYLNTGILILSDPVAIGSKLSDYQADSLFRIIDGRYRQNRPTFVTSNVKTQSEAESLLGSQIVDRLTHGGLRLRCQWESYRQRESNGEEESGS